MNLENYTESRKDPMYKAVVMEGDIDFQVNGIFIYDFFHWTLLGLIFSTQGHFQETYSSFLFSCIALCTVVSFKLGCRE